MDEMEHADAAVVALDESTLSVCNSLARQRGTTRTVWTQKEMHDAYQAELVSLELIPMGSLTEHKRALLTARIAKIKNKLNLSALKIASQAEVVQSKKIRMNFESRV
jgi:hypothetical protein